jgi:hypothetical protein
MSWKKSKGGSRASCGTGGGIYCLGFIGALVYYIQTSSGFWMGVWGVIKALLWPAFVVYELMGYLGM